MDDRSEVSARIKSHRINWAAGFRLELHMNEAKQIVVQFLVTLVLPATISGQTKNGSTS